MELKRRIKIVAIWFERRNILHFEDANNYADIVRSTRHLFGKPPVYRQRSQDEKHKLKFLKSDWLNLYGNKQLVPEHQQCLLVLLSGLI